MSNTAARPPHNERPRRAPSAQKTKLKKICAAESQRFLQLAKELAFALDQMPPENRSVEKIEDARRLIRDHLIRHEVWQTCANLL